MPSPTDDITRPARRILHICYCTDDGGPVVDLLTEGLGVRKTMETPLEPSSGEWCNLDRELVVAAAFVYDRRGPRVAPAVEVQTWGDPKTVGRPPTDPAAAGMQALGYAVGDLDGAVRRLVGLGCEEISRGTGPGGDATVVLRDPEGVTLDIVEDASIEGSEIRHVRLSVTDLSASVPWYERLGWQEAGRTSCTDGAAFGAAGEVETEVVRLRLPDEPTEVMLVQWNEPATHGRHPADAFHAGLFRMALGVDDTNAAYEELVGEGVSFDRSPLEVALSGTPVPDMWIAFLSDPDGVMYELVQRPRSAFR
jgi:catechol 2,3-dioxygenase-like lactoylglutathione lyase family enzyme